MSHIYATDGPPLAVVGVLGPFTVQGQMDRTAMAGVGTLTISSLTEDRKPLKCTATFNSPPNEKARVKGILDCQNAPEIFVTLRNIGPDQGIGIGKRAQNEELLIFFYHPSKQEAENRLPQVVSDINKARQMDNE